MSWATRQLNPRPDRRVRERRVAGVLFFLTCCSVFTVNLFRWKQVPLLEDPSVLGRSLAFTCTLMGILLAHELGHYAVARMHGFRVGVPWFLPAPFLVGTFGAVIRLEETPRTRTGLLEMGAAGPLAGLAVVVVVMAGWLLVGEPPPPVDDEVWLARPALWWVMSFMLTGAAPAAISVRDPVALGAWIGCLLTAMNLLPFGQLDGGHVAAALAPGRARLVGWVVTAILLVGAFAWPGWAVWAAVLHLLGTRESVEVRRADVPVSARARWMAAAAAGAFLLCFTPVPVWFG